jgi:hypothetical protein
MRRELVLLGLLTGCVTEVEYAANVVTEPVPCYAAEPQVGYTSVSSDMAFTYWTECWRCDDGTMLERTWGPHPRDGQAGPALTDGPSVDIPGGCE